MKALSIKPENVDLILSGKKRIENRGWGKNVKGHIAIHKSGKNGCVVGIMNIKEVISIEEALKKYPEQKDFISGSLCWIIDNVIIFKNPIYCKGKLSLWEVSINNFN